MANSALLKLKNKDIGALAVFCLIGWAIGSAISDPTWAAYTTFLVCDHLFLGWLIFLGDHRTRRPIPIEFILAIHVAFVVLVVVVVTARNSLHFFSLFPLPMVAMALWLLSSAMGYEQDRPEPVGVRRARATEGAPAGQRFRRPAWPRPAWRRARPETASAPVRVETAAGTPVVPVSQPQQPAASSGGQVSQSVPVFPESGVVETGSRRTSAVHEVLTVTESPDAGYKPVVPDLDWPPPAKPRRPDPEYWRDNSIAAELRRTYSEEVARFYPSLVASAEDNEAWIDARGKEDPTHRKVGSTVREEYEEWLSERLLARLAQKATSQTDPSQLN